MCEACREMPAYQSHKVVYALKIARIRVDENVGTWITPAEAGFAEFGVPLSYVTKHSPKVGGYYVVYEDGYKSYSPAKAFEDGYTAI